MLGKLSALLAFRTGRDGEDDMVKLFHYRVQVS